MATCFGAACYTKGVTAQQAPSTARVAERLRAIGVRVDDAKLTRSLYAHDASNYRIEPMAVAFPRSIDDVVSIVETCAEFGMPITARGSGTGMAGNSIGAGMVIDFRRFMHAVERIDPATRTAVVQPGVVLDNLQSAAAAFGLMFGPDPSSHSRATIGGMVGNDACGNHSVAYGRTSDHVLALELVLADGTRALATRSGLTAVHPEDADRVSRVAVQLHAMVQEYAAELGSEFDRSPRQVSGYAAHRLLPSHGFDVARMLVGSEGSLAIVVSATLQLVDVPQSKQLLILGYPDLVTAARDVPALLTHHPSAIEALDTAIVQTMRARRGDAAVPEMPAGDAWLFVEFADTVATASLDDVAERVLRQGNALTATPITESAARAALWRVREDGAGLASNLADGRRGKPGWEDAAVPPEQLADYLEGLQLLQQRHGFSGVLYGHFGAGCVHVRFDFDTATDDGREAMRAFIRDAAALVARCGGSVSGEHGDGRARGELLELMYSPAVLGAFRAIKRAFDPRGLLNPHVIVDAPRLSLDMPTPRRAWQTTFALPADGDELSHAANRCVGIGRCVATHVNAMCPTFDATQQEIDSTRGRARGLQDVFNDSGLATTYVLAALDSCLSCKACAIECPTGVDMATYKAEVLHRHYRYRLRPRAHYSLGWLPRWEDAMARMAPALNALTARPELRSRLAPLLGINGNRRFPVFANRAAKAQLHTLPQRDVPQALLFIDSVTRAFHPELAGAATRVLAAAGVRVHAIVDGDAGVSLISTGQLKAARRTQHRLLDIIDAACEAVPVIVLEPSTAAALVHDLPALTRDERARRLALRTRTFVQALSELAPEWQLPAAFPRRVVLQPHCHERAMFPESAQADWLRARGISVDEAIGCCGMGGNFGFEPGHESLSVAVANRSLLPAIDRAGVGTVILADGFGCRCQVDDLRPAAHARHLAEVLDELL